ncbi:NYN domain-containing protein [Candidatus Dojkabacteria bacterium]|uniref:NYN domain-containing protein n=1 Tax=Candidatus Dojkabacteria bacterium TaxID=2099670 RepID=A0A955RJT3_9BACT|nr:NYN domain-containing protein [Candidatus Dojkabacteria bacterium]
MIVRNPNQRVAVLVDVQNLYYSARNLYNGKINFAKLLEVCVQGRILTRAIAYVINTDEEGKTNDFFDAVNSAGFETKEKPLQTFFGGSKKGDWDVGIAMDAVRLGAKVDSVVLVSGDGDFRPVVNYLQQHHGCLAEVVAFGKTTNNELREMADDFIDLDDRKKDIVFKERRKWSR